MFRYPRKILESFRKNGPQLTLILIKLRFQQAIDIFFPKTICGKRIGLRSEHAHLSQGEISKVFTWSRDPEILRWSAAPLNKLTLDQFIKEQVRKEKRISPDQIVFYIIIPPDQLIGRIGLYDIDWINLDGEFGIFLDQNYWGKQYGREATLLFMHHLFIEKHFKRIHLGTYKDNIRAQRSFIACGFRTIGSSTRYNPLLDQTLEGVEMEINRNEFTYDRQADE